MKKTLTPSPVVESPVKPPPHRRRSFYHRFLLALALSGVLRALLALSFKGEV